MASLFERSAIEQWLRCKRWHPLTGPPASVDDLVADLDAKARVDAFVARLRDDAQLGRRQRRSVRPRKTPIPPSRRP
jgi:hypothetical protein